MVEIRSLSKRYLRRTNLHTLPPPQKADVKAADRFPSCSSILISYWLEINEGRINLFFIGYSEQVPQTALSMLASFSSSSLSFIPFRLILFLYSLRNIFINFSART